jgi:DNA-binding HxlR family transcriptional regulator
VAETGECGCVLADEEIGSCYCVLEPLVQAVGRRYALPVLNVIAARRVAHFNEIQEQLGDMSSSTLATRLQELEVVGLIRRERPDGERSEYRLTTRGKTLRDSLRRLFPRGEP